MQSDRAAAAALVCALLACVAACVAGGGSSRGFDPTGTAWLAEDIGGSQVADGVQSTLAFEEGAAVHGNTGCNSFQGAITLRGAFLSFGPLATTRRACPEVVMDQEQRFLAALEATRLFEKSGRFLLLLGEDGAPLVRLAPGDH